MAEAAVNAIARWPARLMELCLELRSTPTSPQARDAARSEAWLLLNAALMRYLRIHATRIGGTCNADLEDVAAVKSLDLLRSAEDGTWNLSGRSCSELPAYLSTVARNGLIDVLRASGRRAPLPDAVAYGADAEQGPIEAIMTGSPPSDDPALAAEGREFARALRDCAKRLDERSRLIWFFRVFYDLTTKEIARHPEVSLKPGHVDVILQRTRAAVKQCMAAKGHRPEDMPPGAFAELWCEFQLPSAESGESLP